MHVPCFLYIKEVSCFMKVGSDIPGITEEVIKEGFQVLESGEAEMILGPAKDGGYYTVGMTAAASKHLGELWSLPYCMLYTYHTTS